MCASLVPVAWLRKRFKYDGRTGIITYRIGNAKTLGQPAGTINSDGYVIIRVPFEGKRIEFKAHRLAWALYHGEHPLLDVDHRDLNRANNRIRNLRHASRSFNLANRAQMGDLPKGVTKCKRAKARPFQAQITVDGQYRYLGRFACPDEAHQVYMVEAKKAFGEFARAA